MVNVRMDISELVERLRKIVSDTQDCEVKEAVRKLPESLPETISAFANKDGGIIILGLSEKSNFTPAEGFDAKKIFSAMMEVGDVMTPPVRMKIDMVPFENAQIVVVRECLDFCVQGGFQGGSQSRLPFVYRGLKINDQRTLSRRHKCAKRGECGAPSGGFHHTLHHSIALVNRSPNSRPELPSGRCTQAPNLS